MGHAGPALAGALGAVHHLRRAGRDGAAARLRRVDGHGPAAVAARGGTVVRRIRRRGAGRLQDGRAGAPPPGLQARHAPLAQGRDGRVGRRDRLARPGARLGGVHGPGRALRRAGAHTAASVRGLFAAALERAAQPLAPPGGRAQPGGARRGDAPGRPAQLGRHRRHRCRLGPADGAGLARGHRRAPRPGRGSARLRARRGPARGAAGPAAPQAPYRRRAGRDGRRGRPGAGAGAAAARHGRLARVCAVGGRAAHRLPAGARRDVHPAHPPNARVRHAVRRRPGRAAGGGRRRGRPAPHQPDARDHAGRGSQLVGPTPAAALAAGTKGRRCSLRGASCSSCCWRWRCW